MNLNEEPEPKLVPVFNPCLGGYQLKDSKTGIIRNVWYTKKLVRLTSRYPF